MIVLAIDTETTGLIDSRLMPLDRQPHVIEFCGILVDLSDSSVIDRYDTLIRPPRKDLVSEKITAITHISWNDLESAPPFSEVADKIISMIEKAPAVAAHNVLYDRDMVDFEAKRIGVSIKWPRLLCSIESSVHLQGKRLNLTNLHAALIELPFKDAHRAGADTEALVRCLVEMNRREWL